MIKVNVLNDAISKKVNYMLEQKIPGLKANMEDLFREIDKINVNSYQKVLMAVNELPIYVLLVLIIVIVLMFYLYVCAVIVLLSIDVL